jgi:hypothetical protein
MLSIRQLLPKGFGKQKGFDLHSQAPLSLQNIEDALYHRTQNPDAIKDKYAFFVMPFPEIESGIARFTIEHIDEYNSLPWFMYIRGDRDSHIIVPNQSWYHIEPDKKRYVQHTVHQSVWDVGGGIFQLDKNEGKPLYITHESIEDVLKLVTKSMRRLNAP